ncbi:MAG TPA: serine/threonine-protein kinase, partial [Casimicrobiaceae bacterium]|nr:serine/threonine-protein kinase [Casimicrobiaceae bacterium]
MNARGSTRPRSETTQEFAGTDRFEIRRRLGEGAFGVVFEAWDRERDERVALKTLRHTSPVGLYRFKQEFRSLADISHPNLVALHELLSEGEQYFFTMELIEGADFLDFVRAPGATKSRRTHSDVAATLVADSESSVSSSQPFGPGLAPTLPVRDSTLTTDEVLAAPRESVERVVLPVHEGTLRKALVELARGVNALHDAGKLHRDIKPSNVLVTREGRVILLDFGLVSDVSANAEGDTIESRVAGTPEYMSPEQASGLAASEASDWYSVGTMLYEALCGRLPFEGNIPTILAAKVLSEPTPPSEFAQGVPPDLEALCMELLRRKPELRPNGREVIRRLGEASTTRRARSTRNVPLVGRTSHVAALESSLAAARDHAVLVLLHGRSGMGKTTIVRRFLDALRHREPDAVILAGNCYEQESVPYKALDSLVDALSQHLERLPDEKLSAVLPANILALARLFPVLQRLDAVQQAEASAVEIT